MAENLQLVTGERSLSLETQMGFSSINKDRAELFQYRSFVRVHMAIRRREFAAQLASCNVKATRNWLSSRRCLWGPRGCIRAEWSDGQVCGRVRKARD